jgi:hypothetical protein
VAPALYGRHAERRCVAEARLLRPGDLPGNLSFLFARRDRASCVPDESAGPRRPISFSSLRPSAGLKALCASRTYSPGPP